MTQTASSHADAVSEPRSAGDRARIAGPLILVIAAFVTLTWALIYGGGAADSEAFAVGPVVRWGVPISKLVVNLAAAGMVGALVTALFALKPEMRAFQVALNTASASAALFTVAAAATAYFTFLDVLAVTPSIDALSGEQLGMFLTQTEPGRMWLLTVVLGAAITVLTFAVRGWAPVLLVTLLALATLLPMGTLGHSGDQTNHNVAVSALILHLVAAAVWLGGLLLMVLIRPTVSRTTIATDLLRYSSLALVSFVVIVISGTVRGVIAVGAWAYLLSPYGVILLVKVVALLVLGGLGAWYRRGLIARVAAGRSPFWKVILCELVFLGIASGAAAALARTPPPTNEVSALGTTPAERLTGSPLPPELTPARWITEWDIDLWWGLAAAFGIFFYLAGVWRLHRRGDKWPVLRTVSWVAGCLWLFWVTCGAVNAYGDYLFSVHMLGHMFLSMGIPMLLVLGAPITLALRAIRKRTDGTRGGREWIMWAIHTPYSRIITNPIVAAAVFIVSLWAFYFTDMIRWSLYEHVGHQFMITHFLIAGYLFVQSLIGIDPVPYRMPYAFRLVVLLAVLAMHAFFGLALMMHTGLIAAEWYGSMARPWGATPLEDQYVGGGIAWSVGEIPALILAIIVAVQWSRSDERKQSRRDRHADRTGDAELEAYNARLAALAERDTAAGR